MEKTLINTLLHFPRVLVDFKKRLHSKTQRIQFYNKTETNEKQKILRRRRRLMNQE